MVITTISNVIGLVDSGDRPLGEALAELLHDKQLLLVLDNFEQVLDASPVVLELLEACPDLNVLVTSREALYVAGEQQFHVPALQTAASESLPTFQTLQEVPAIALFVERARAVKPDFALNEQNAQAVAAICAHLEGVPLAIELAAARVNLLSPQEMQTRRGDSLSFLESAARYLPPRQRTLRGAIDWSYQRLSYAEQLLFASLGVFVGGFDLPGAEVVCNAPEDIPLDMLTVIGSLLDKNLLKRGRYLGNRATQCWS